MNVDSGFDLNNNQPIHNEVGYERLFEVRSLEFEADSALPNDLMPQANKIASKNDFVDGFKKSRSQLLMNSNGRPSCLRVKTMDSEADKSGT